MAKEPSRTRRNTDTTAMTETNLNQEEDASCWIPLEQESPASSSAQQATSAPAVSTLSSSLDTGSTTVPRPPRRESLEVARKRLDSKIKLKEGLVDHPLNRAWRLFAKHLVNELWQLDVHLRLGMVLVVIGTLLQVLMWACSFRWYHPRTILLVLVFSVSFVYLAPKDVERQFAAFLQLIKDPSAIEYVNPNLLRRLLVSLLLLPTMLEMRNFGFLSHAVAESGFLYNALVGMLLAVFVLYRFKCVHATPRDCLLRGIHLFYGIALLLTLARADLRRLPALAGPFLLSTGTLLLSYGNDDNVWSRALRHALRLTLRDVLSSVGETVSQDEMLQLAMLRWIVDYWSYRPTETNTSSATSTATSTNETTSRVSTRPSSSSDAPQQQHELQWEELQPMLDMTTHQMEEEVPTHPVDSIPSFQSRPPTGTFAQTRNEDNGSVQNLRSMLASFNVDDRAKPAVMAYKQAVTSFPPSRRDAVWISILKRCPATLALLYLYLVGSDVAFASTLTLLPFVVMEAFRVLHWADACQRTLGPQGQDSQEVVTRGDVVVKMITIPADMDPMCILLSGDVYDPLRPPPLLQVWVNVCSSVVALEAGLTAARCAQTTAVAADFAGNLMSLAQFGVEVSQHGWLHGLTVMIQEVVYMHATGGDNTKYASAAVNAVRNGSIVARNVRALAEEDAHNPVIQPLLGVLSAVIGHGWLWGREEQSHQESSVTIEEILRDEEVEGNVAQESVPIEATDTEESSPPSPARNLQMPPSGTKETESGENLSELMELIADAFEKNLIQESEKNAFMETLLVTGSGQDCRPSKATVEQMERSLRNLLESSESGVAEQNEIQASSESTRPFSQEGGAGHSTSIHRSPVALVEEEEDDQFEPIQSSQKSSETGIGAVSDDQPPFAHTEDSLEARLSIAPRSSADNPSNEECDTSHSVHQVTMDVVAEATAGTQTQVDEVNGRDEWTKWVGGGIAVLGVVAGGIAIASASQREDDRSRHSNSSRANDVYIEELDGDDDENGDEWVTVSASNTF